MKHSTSWLLWLIVTISILLNVRHPVYLFILIIGLLVVGNSLAKRKGASRWARNNLRFLLTMILLSSIINMLFSHTGKTILFKIPDPWLLVGGNITLESLVYGAINGLIIGALYLAFNIINLALSIKQITNLIPRMFFPIAMVVTVALTFFPSIQQRASEIKESQIIRGNPMKHFSDWLPLLIPLLVSSLEDAFQLAESMTARGFHSAQSGKRQDILLVGFLFGTLSLFSGWILGLYNYPRLISTLLAVSGLLIWVFSLTFGNRYTKIIRFNKEHWGHKDILSVILMAFIAISWIILKLTNRFPQFVFNPYPRLVSPPIEFTGILFSLFTFIPCLFYEND
ncbi:MAG: energy-coupling factor transporter transmembrane component T [Brevefilum sp.]|jgi:energy-coupling factor transport system permease protein